MTKAFHVCAHCAPHRAKEAPMPDQIVAKREFFPGTNVEGGYQGLSTEESIKIRRCIEDVDIPRWASKTEENAETLKTAVIKKLQDDGLISDPYVDVVPKPSAGTWSVFVSVAENVPGIYVVLS